MILRARTMLTALVAIALPVLWGAAPRGESFADRMTSGKLQADLGNYKAALEQFAAIAQAERAPESLRGEALVRVGLAKRALGDDPGSVAAFQEAVTQHRDDREVLWLLAQAVGSAVPARERWDEIWRQVRLEVDRSDPAHPRAVVIWPARVRSGGPSVSIPSPAGRKFAGNPISLDFKDGNIQDVFRLFADISGLNVVVNPGVNGAVSLRVSNRPWDEVLEQILAVNGYTYRIDGNVLWIAIPDDLAPPRSYTGKAIDIDFREEPLDSALRQIARAGGLSVEVGPGIAGRMTFKLEGVKWDQAFDLVARINGLSWTKKNGVLRVTNPGR